METQSPTINKLESCLVRLEQMNQGCSQVDSTMLGDLFGFNKKKIVRVVYHPNETDYKYEVVQTKGNKSEKFRTKQEIYSALEYVFNQNITDLV